MQANSIRQTTLVRIVYFAYYSPLPTERPHLKVTVIVVGPIVQLARPCSASYQAGASTGTNARLLAGAEAAVLAGREACLAHVQLTRRVAALLASRVAALLASHATLHAAAAQLAGLLTWKV